VTANIHLVYENRT